MEPDWELLETQIKGSTNHWDRFCFTAEQVTHAYVNIYVEKGREYNIPKPICKIVAYASLATYVPIIMGIYAVYNWYRR